LTLEQLDFAWDFLDPHIEAIEREIFCRTADLFRADGDLIFWDTTRGSFAVDEEDEVEETRRGTTLPALRQAGDSTEGHDSDPQVGVGLALTRDGLPGRSWVFPGTTVDTTTGAQVKEDLRGWRLGQAIFGGDAGMDSEAHRHELATGVGHDLLAMPRGKRTEVQPEVLARPGRFHRVNEPREGKEGRVGDGARQRRDLVCRNLEEAPRPRQHREALVTARRQERDRLAPQARAQTKRAWELVASKRYGRSLARGPGGRLTIDPAAVQRATRMDGKSVLLTNDDPLPRRMGAWGPKRCCSSRPASGA
jgi:hypothetical protein